MTYPPTKNKTKSPKPKIVATYDYHDEHGQLSFQVARYEPGFAEGDKKTFRQRRPNGKDGWIMGRGNVPKVLYRLPELLAADPVERTVFVVEGEKDVDTLRDLEIIATTNPEGAGKWLPQFNSALRGRHVVILPDNDKPGRDHARTVAESLKGVAASIKVVELPGLPEKGDVSDWLQIQGNDKTDLLKLVKATPQFWPPPEADLDPGPGAGDGKDAGQAGAAEPDKKAKPTQAEVLLALAGVHDFFHSLDGRAYVAVKVAGTQGEHRETFPVRSTGYRQMLARDYYLQTKKAVSSGILQDVLAVLEARALFEGPCREVGIRVMGAAGYVYLDLADERWRAVEIGPAGWKVLDTPPVYFRRSRGMLPLPAPQRGGSLNDLRPLLNLGSEDEWKLSIAWMVQALRPTGPYPPLGLHGEQGSAKSTRSRLLRGLIDPNVAALRSAPREERDLVIAAHNSWILALDNLSDLPQWLSDALCRLATGGGYATRELFSDMDETILDAMRPILLNGIEEVSTKPDLLDRGVILTLPALDEQKRRPERELWAEYEAIRPRVLGALLDAVAGALHYQPQVKLERLPRMADFALLGEAVGMALDWPKGEFAKVYKANRDDQTGAILEGSIIYPALRALVPAAGKWEGTAGQLLSVLNKQTEARTHDRAWPGNGRVLSGALRRLAPTLRKAGLAVEFFRETDAKRTRKVRITEATEQASNSPSAPSAPSGAHENNDFSVAEPPDAEPDAEDLSADGGGFLASGTEPRQECGADHLDAADDDLPPRSSPGQEDHGDAWGGDDIKEHTP